MTNINTMKMYGIVNVTHGRMASVVLYQTRKIAFVELRKLRESDPDGHFRVVAV